MIKYASFETNPECPIHLFVFAKVNYNCQNSASGFKHRSDMLLQLNLNFIACKTVILVHNLRSAIKQHWTTRQNNRVRMREVEHSTLAGIWGHKKCNICPLCIKKACNLGTPLTKFRAISLAYCSLFFETESVEAVLVTQDAADYLRKPVDKSDQLNSCIHYTSSHLM